MTKVKFSKGTEYRCLHVLEQPDVYDNAKCRTLVMEFPIEEVSMDALNALADDAANLDVIKHMNDRVPSIQVDGNGQQVLDEQGNPVIGFTTAEDTFKGYCIKKQLGPSVSMTGGECVVLKLRTLTELEEERRKNAAWQARMEEQMAQLQAALAQANL